MKRSNTTLFGFGFKKTRRDHTGMFQSNRNIEYEVYFYVTSYQICKNRLYQANHFHNGCVGPNPYKILSRLKVI